MVNSVSVGTADSGPREEFEDITAIPLVYASDVYMTWVHEVVNAG